MSSTVMKEERIEPCLEKDDPLPDPDPSQCHNPQPQSPVKCCHIRKSLVNSIVSMTTNATCGKTVHAILDIKRKKKEEELAALEAAKIMDRKDDIRKQRTDSFKYRYIQLENGVRLMLVRNPKATTSAAALDIKIGSFSDPLHLQGLAHLCEHVLFTGSEGFPNESYSHFLGQRGGSSNAYTASEHTNFHFDVPSQHFEEALARFVSFFECPIFRETSVQSELDIVQSEHEKNRWNDLWRTNQVERTTANENHAFSRFSTGNRKTLTVDEHAHHNLRYELFNFFKTNYSANLMTVCLVHNRSLDQMEELAKTNFLRIANRNIPETIWPNRPFKPSQMKTKIYIVPVKDVYHVNLTFPLQDLHPHYRSSPEGFCAQLIGYKGPNGLFSYLRKIGYAHHLVAGWKNLARGFSFFIITIQMTEIGERYVDDIVKFVFQYLNLLRAIGPQKWFFDELQYLSQQQFESKDLEKVQTYASNVANWLHIYPPEDCLIADYVFEEWNRDVIKLVLKHLVPDNVRVTILSKKCRYFTTMVEPHFATEYHVERIGEEVLNVWRSCGRNEEHKLPSPNNLIDKEMRMVPTDGIRESGLPDLLIYHKRINFLAWFLPATSSKLAKAFVCVKISHPDLASVDATSCALKNLFVALIRDTLTEYAYQGELAGIFYSLKPIKTGLELYVRGYSANQHIFLKNVLKVLYAYEFEQSRFDQVLEVQMKNMATADGDSLKAQSKFLLGSILCPRNYSRMDRLHAYKKSSISFHHMMDFAHNFRLHNHQECFFYGNLTPHQADVLANTILEARKHFLEQLAQARNVQVESNCLLEEWFVKNPVERVVMLEKALLAKAQSKVESEHLNGILEQNVDTISCDASLNQENNFISPEEPQTMEDKGDQSENSNAMDLNQEVRLQPTTNQTGYLFLVHNEIQSSSCVLHFLQFRENTPENHILLELFLHLVRVRLVSSMKYVVPLGYVVGCDIRRINNTLGFRIIVESQYPLTLVNETIENSLADLGEYLESIDEETFHMSREALITTKIESHKRFRDKALNFWKEILDSSYNFQRLDQELECLRHLDMKSLLQFYRDWIAKTGRERRCLILSIGPDPILNCIDGTEAFHLGQEKEKVYESCDTFSTPSKTQLASWYQMVFERQDFEYDPPESSTITCDKAEP